MKISFMFIAALAFAVVVCKKKGSEGLGLARFRECRRCRPRSRHELSDVVILERILIKRVTFRGNDAVLTVK